MASLSDFAYEELNSSGKGQLGQDGEATKIYKIAWADLPAFITMLVGGWQKLTDASFVWNRPDKHPDWEMYCAAVSYEGTGLPSQDTAGKSSWEYAKLTATYRSLQYDFSFDPKDIVTEELDFSLESEVLPANSFETSVGADNVPDPITKLVPTLTYSLTYHFLPDLNVAAIYTLLGKVNNAVFKGASAAQLLFVGANASRTTTTAGNPNWRVGFKYIFRPRSWQKAFVATSGDYVEVVDKINGNNIYEAGDFTAPLPS